jgi:hypothetical protein
MRRQLRIVAFGFFAFGAFWTLLAVWLLMLGVADEIGKWDSLNIGLVLVSTLAAIPLLIAGWGLLHLKRWARLLAIVLAVIGLPMIPIGTAFGLFALWVLFSDGTKMLFNPAIESN